MSLAAALLGLVILMNTDLSNHHIYIYPVQSPREIKRREVSWTLTKKLDTFADPGEIKRRKVVLDPQVSPEEIKSMEVELDLKVGFLLPQLFLNSGATDIVFCDSDPHNG